MNFLFHHHTSTFTALLLVLTISICACHRSCPLHKWRKRREKSKEANKEVAGSSSSSPILSSTSPPSVSSTFNVSSTSLARSRNTDRRKGTSNFCNRLVLQFHLLFLRRRGLIFSRSWRKGWFEAIVGNRRLRIRNGHNNVAEHHHVALGLEQRTATHAQWKRVRRARKKSIGI